MYRMLSVLVVGLGVVMLALPGGVRADDAPPPQPVGQQADDAVSLDAVIAALEALDVAGPVITDRFAGTVLLDEATAGVAADTGVVTAEGFTAQLNLRDDLGLLVWTDFVQVAPNGTLLFMVDPTVLLMQSGDLTLEVLVSDLITNQVSVAASLNLMPLAQMYGTDSVSQTTARVIATGDLAQIRGLLDIARLTGGLTTADVAALEAAAARIAAAAAAAPPARPPSPPPSRPLD